MNSVSSSNTKKIGTISAGSRSALGSSSGSQKSGVSSQVSRSGQSSKDQQKSKTSHLSVQMKMNMVKMRQQQILRNRYDSMVSDLAEFKFYSVSDPSKPLAFHEKLLQIYAKRYRNFKIESTINENIKSYIISTDGGDDEDDLKDRKEANQVLLKLFEYIEKFSNDEKFTCAVLHQCTLDICNAELPEKVKVDRAQFLQNISEYFFGNLWQDDKLQFTQDTYLFSVFYKLSKENFKDHPEQLKVLTKNLLKGLYSKLINVNYIKNIMSHLVQHEVSQTDKNQKINLAKEIVTKLQVTLSEQLELMPFTQRAMLSITTKQLQQQQDQTIYELMFEPWLIQQIEKHLNLFSLDSEFNSLVLMITKLSFQNIPLTEEQTQFKDFVGNWEWLTTFNSQLINVHIKDQFQLSKSLVENSNLISVSDMIAFLGIIQSLVISFDQDLMKDPDGEIFMNREKYRKDGTKYEDAKDKIREKVASGKVFKAHEDSAFLNTKSQFLILAKVLKPGFQANNQEMTHLLFLKQWESNLNFKDDIEKNGRRFLEDKITPNFFKSGSNLDKIEEDQNEEGDEDGDSDDMMQSVQSGPVEKAEESKEENSTDTDSINKKKKIVSAIYKNIQDIMSYPGSSIERIRDPSVSSKYGLVNDFGLVLAEISKDDVLQPKINNTLRLQDQTIKSWFTKFFASQTKAKVPWDSSTLNRLLELMLQTNEKTITDWAKKLEDSITAKTVIQRDILRFEAQIDCYLEWQQRLLISQNKKRTEQDSIFPIDQIWQKINKHAPELHQQDKATDWQAIIKSKDIYVSHNKVSKIKERYPYKAIGLFTLYECLRSERKQGKIGITKGQKLKNPDVPSQYEINVFQNQEIQKYLQALALERFDIKFRENAKRLLSSYNYKYTEEERDFPDLYDDAIERVKQLKNLKYPTEKLGVILDAFEIAKASRAYFDMTFEQQAVNLKPLTPDVQLLILKYVDFDELLFVDYVIKPQFENQQFKGVCQAHLAVKLVRDYVERAIAFDIIDQGDISVKNSSDKASSVRNTSDQVSN